MQLKLGKIYTDTTNKAIYLFTKVAGDDLYGLYWQARPITIKSGAYKKKDWLDFFATTRSSRFIKLKDLSISENRRHKMISQIFELRLNI